MFNVTVLKLKDIMKYIICIFVLILLIFSVTNYFSQKKTEKTNQVTTEVENVTNKVTNNNLLSCLDATLPVVASINHHNDRTKEKMNESNILKTILKTQISSINQVQNQDIKKEENNIELASDGEKKEEQEENEQKESNLELAKVNQKTEVITNNPIADNFNTQYENIKIKNQTDYVLTNEMMTPDISIENKNIIIFHTHSCESYTPSEKYQYEASGNFRTRDLNYSVTRVGTELTNQLQQYGYNVIHDTSYHDYPSYNGSYTSSLNTVENLLKTNSADIIIDLHRDAVGSRSDYAPTVKIGDEEVAQVMFVIGTNNGGLWHPNWNQNLKFAIKMQQKAEEMYPGLFKSIMLTKSRYNQHTGKYANIMEVGATGNTLDQCIASTKYLAKVMDELLSQ